MYTINNQDHRRASLPSAARRSYAREKDSDYDSDATLDIEDLTTPGRPFGAPLRRMSDGPMGVPVQLVGQKFNSNKRRDTIEVFTLPICDIRPEQKSSTPMPQIKRSSSMSTCAPLRKLVDKVVSKSIPSSQSSIASRPINPSPLGGGDIKAPQITSPTESLPSSYSGAESQKQSFTLRPTKRKAIFNQVS